MHTILAYIISKLCVPMPITRRQPEYGKPAGEYVNSIASPARIKAGLRKAEEWRTTLDAIEKKYKVERWILLAIWGMETSYGAVKDKWDVIRSLATLAHNNYRHPYFRNELIVALRILQEGHIAPQAQGGGDATGGQRINNVAHNPP
ncbi:MAG: lytic murein transglycosylase, partial [Candidatus Bathyarchaeia archaeon]